MEEATTENVRDLVWDFCEAANESKIMRNIFQKYTNKKKNMLWRK